MHDLSSQFFNPIFYLGLFDFIHIVVCRINNVKPLAIVLFQNALLRQ